MSSPKDKEKKVSSCCGVGMLWIDGIILACKKCSKECTPVSPNKPTTLIELDIERFTKEREDQFERAFIGIDSLTGLPQYTQHPDLMKKFNRETILMLASELTSHNTELLRKIEGLKEKYPVDAVHATEFETKINWANPAVHQALDEVISLIKQE